jgi:hypothetical protein
MADIITNNRTTRNPQKKHKITKGKKNNNIHPIISPFTPITLSTHQQPSITTDAWNGLPLSLTSPSHYTTMQEDIDDKKEEE